MRRSAPTSPLTTATFADIFSRCSCSAADSEAVADAFSKSLSIPPVDLDIRDLVSEIRTKRREVDERKDALVLLETISSLFDRLRAVREDLRAGRLVEAVNDLKVALLVEESGEEEPAVYGLLRKEWLDFFDELQEVLARHAQSCVQFEPENNKMIVRGRSGDVELRTAMEAMEIAGVMDYGLAKVADLVIKHATIGDHC